MKYSRQRESILQYLRSTTCHPTAETVYQHIVADHPNISLGTVYRNLTLLTELGEINKITAFDGPDVLMGMWPHTIIFYAGNAALSLILKWTPLHI